MATSASLTSKPTHPALRSETRRSPSDLGIKHLTGGRGPRHGFTVCRCIVLGCESGEHLDRPGFLCTEDALGPLPKFQHLSPLPPPPAYYMSSSSSSSSALATSIDTSSSSELSSPARAQKCEPATGRKLDDEPTLELAPNFLSSSMVVASSSLPLESAYTRVLTSAFRLTLSAAIHGRGASVSRRARPAVRPPRPPTSLSHLE